MLILDKMLICVERCKKQEVFLNKCIILLNATSFLVITIHNNKPPFLRDQLDVSRNKRYFYLSVDQKVYRILFNTSYLYMFWMIIRYNIKKRVKEDDIFVI
ncbi:hypothetical protein AWH48_15940 [Domibacillus aminovorans]|uniref:Uncharacterized protein n=1 Tax=Domibacillus aminovorans TaxID=29332 RepID=A0A177L1G7_9BACI|nr:hypothetical protein AWH48_15940 [Domibacillus aminovorans]